MLSNGGALERSVLTCGGFLLLKHRVPGPVCPESISLLRTLIHVFRRCAILSILWLPISIPPLRAAPDDPALLQVKILEGEGASYAPGSRATRGVTIQVSDETGKPVEATVTFRLPEDGPGGVFANGSRTEIAATDAGGRASVWGMQWNRTPGSFELRITASKGAARAGTVCSLYLTDKAEKSRSGPRVRSGHKWLWIAIGVAGGAATLGVARSTGSSTGTAATSTASVTLGTPTVSIGRRQ